MRWQFSAGRERAKNYPLSLSPLGILYAFGGAVGQALGLVLSKLGLKDYDPFAATQIRIIAGIAGYSILVTILADGEIYRGLSETGME